MTSSEEVPSGGPGVSDFLICEARKGDYGSTAFVRVDKAVRVVFLGAFGTPRHMRIGNDIGTIIVLLAPVGLFTAGISTSVKFKRNQAAGETA
jgi:hypothetical protein